jgi:hypothetical protein
VAWRLQQTRPGTLVRQPTHPFHVQICQRQRTLDWYRFTPSPGSMFCLPTIQSFKDIVQPCAPACYLNLSDRQSVPEVKLSYAQCLTRVFCSWRTYLIPHPLPPFPSASACRCSFQANTRNYRPVSTAAVRGRGPPHRQHTTTV